MATRREKLFLILPTIVSLVIVLFLNARVDSIESMKSTLSSDLEDMWKNQNTGQILNLQSSMFILGSELFYGLDPHINKSETISEFVKGYIDYARQGRIHTLRSLSVKLNIDNARKESWNDMDMNELAIEVNAMIDIAQEEIYDKKDKIRAYDITISNLNRTRKFIEFLGYSSQIILILSRQEKK